MTVHRLPSVGRVVGPVKLAGECDGLQLGSRNGRAGDREPLHRATCGGDVERLDFARPPGIPMPGEFRHFLCTERRPVHDDGDALGVGGGDDELIAHGTHSQTV